MQYDRFQQEAIDHINAGHSVIVSAPTGAGKTAIAEHRGHIAEELLAVRLQEGDLTGEAVRKALDICGHPLAATLRPAA